jgi:hypothetical protein
MGRKKIPEDQKATKPGVSMDKECRIILSKIMEYETSLRNDLAQSQAIRKCMRLAWDLHYKALFEKYEATQTMDGIALLNEESPQKSSSKASNIAPNVGAKKVRLSESLGSGSLTRSTGSSRRTG